MVHLLSDGTETLTKDGSKEPFSMVTICLLKEKVPEYQYVERRYTLERRKTRLWVLLTCV
ncbi:hypothetical protein Hdeb2414_s0023g00623621 [Helianthus debilis subsp. tardiflorus]